MDNKNKSLSQRPKKAAPTGQRPPLKKSNAQKPTGKKPSKPRKNTAPKKNAQPSKWSILLIVGVTAVIILVIFASAILFSPSNGNLLTDDPDRETELITGETSHKTGFPLSFPAGIDNVEVNENSLYVLSRNRVTQYDLSASRGKENIFNFASPVLKTSSKYAIVYDRQGISFAVLKKDKIVFEGKTGDGEYINNAFICDSGNFLIASRSEKASGLLTYYSRTGEILFQWLCANEYIVNCAVSENDENLVCSAISANGGEMYTKIYYFDIDKTENNKEKSFSGAVALDCFFVSNRSVVAVCSDRRILIDFSNEKLKSTENEYSSTILKQASDERGNTAVIRKKDNSFDKSILTVYDSHNNISFECDLPDDIKALCIRAGKAYVLTADGIYKADKHISKVKELTFVNSSMTASGRKLYYYTSSVLNRLD